MVCAIVKSYHTIMGATTKIKWADSTWNPWSGCTKVSPGCANCYAETLSKNKFFGGGKTIGKWGKGAPRKLHESAFKMAFSLNRKPWICDECGYAKSYHDSGQYCNAKNKNGELCKCTSQHRRRIFSLSLGDWLDEEVPIEWVARMLDTIRQCDQVTWILCSKRWENFMLRVGNLSASLTEQGGDFYEWLHIWVSHNSPPKNIIGLCSVENQERADNRIPQFLTVPLACHGLSLEPLLSSVGFGCDGALFKGIDWSIVGCESGSKRRYQIEYEESARSIIRQGQSAQIAVFHKQMPINGSVSHEPTEWPEDLRVQQWPKGF
ncbi:MAG: DUF5131 family protein [Patescibacteria group bacterium]|nr:DUF5131 family protein [Patescibacteria group bacterium]